MCADDLGELLLGECKLQTYLKENPIKQGASPRGPRPKLVEVRKHLTAALDRGNLKVTVDGATVDQPVYTLWCLGLFSPLDYQFSNTHVYVFARCILTTRKLRKRSEILI